MDRRQAQIANHRHQARVSDESSRWKAVKPLAQVAQHPPLAHWWSSIEKRRCRHGWTQIAAMNRGSPCTFYQVGESPITDLQARPVEVWLNTLALAPKSRVHVRGVLYSSLEVRNVEARCTDAGQSHVLVSVKRYVQADTAAAQSNG